VTASATGCAICNGFVSCSQCLSNSRHILNDTHTSNFLAFPAGLGAPPSPSRPQRNRRRVTDFVALDADINARHATVPCTGLKFAAKHASIAISAISHCRVNQWPSPPLHTCQNLNVLLLVFSDAVITCGGAVKGGCVAAMSHCAQDSHSQRRLESKQHPTLDSRSEVQ